MADAPKTPADDDPHPGEVPTTIVRISKDLHHQLRILAAHRGLSLRQVLDEAIAAHIQVEVAARKIIFSPRP